MKLSDLDLDVRDREWVERVVQADEELLLVCKPQARLWRKEYVPIAIFTVLWLGIVGCITGVAVPQVIEQVAERPAGLIVVLFLLPFWLIGLGLLSSPWRLREVARRTVYLLTSKRAVVLCPTAFRFRPTLQEYPLQYGMLKEVKAERDGSGSLVFDYEERHTKNGVHYVPKGFLHVPQVCRVEAALREQIGEVCPPPAKEDAAAAEEEPAAEFPNVVTLLVGGFFMLVGGSQAYDSAEKMMQDTQLTDWWFFLLAVGWPLMFAIVGFFAARQWVREFIKYRKNRQQIALERAIAENEEKRKLGVRR